uniref:Uncharacterized protein n=1 Tax=viral metagenome TaxID=1070528 RepID=A0A6C0LYX5_9ZZZZ
MPSFFKHFNYSNHSYYSNALKGGVQKLHASNKYFLKKTNAYLLKHIPVIFSPPPLPCSSVFDSNDCIWYHGTLYVRENVAVAKLQSAPGSLAPGSLAPGSLAPVSATLAPGSLAPGSLAPVSATLAPDDDDNESVSSGSSGINHPRNIGKANQLKYLKDGMQLRHITAVNENTHCWNATFDAENNRIIRRPDGVAFETLRQFARLHCNEVLGTMVASYSNVWCDPHFQYQHDDGSWHALSKLKC